MQEQNIGKILFKQTMKNNSYWVLNRAAVQTLGVEAAFMLSALADAEELFSDDEGWFFQTIETIQSITTLSRRKQNTCIKVLEENKVIKTDLRGMPAKRHFKILHMNATNLFVQSEQTSMSETSKLDSPKRAANKEHTDKADNQSNNYKHEASEKKKKKAADSSIDEALFERLWKLYPRKEGKAAVSKKAKKEITEIGFLPMWRAIMRYEWEVQGRERQFILMGSTFFNGRYVDFLDDKYEGEWPREEPSYSNGGWTKEEQLAFEQECRNNPSATPEEQKANAEKVWQAAFGQDEIWF